ncbi:MAG: phosphodiester glycosidase family protein [Candidatus Levybacteria bacterium]|nr:phosphodiester glycosidase family protein [Candidatus Levybacteria bacterium]
MQKFLLRIRGLAGFAKLKALKRSHLLIFFLFLISIATIFVVLELSSTEKELTASLKAGTNLSEEVKRLKTDFETLKNTDQIKRNNDLESNIKEIEKTYKDTLIAYEQMTDLPSSAKELPDYKKRFAKILKLLSEKNYASGSAESVKLKADVEKTRIALLPPTGSNGIAIDVSTLPVNNAPPGSGYSRQRVDALGSSYLVDIVAGNLSTTRVIVDTASDSDCRDNCPTLPLGTYISRNGAYAGINGSYFCPAEYPSCAGKTNTFDTLAMGKNKHYHNSDNNVYSTVPAVIFGGGWVRFVGQSLQWGRDTGVDGVLANQPLLLSGGNVTFGGDGDPKKGSRGNRSFVANKGNTVYIGVVRNVTVAEAAQVLKVMGMENALNLDSGGSTALWSGGYKAGPGRNIPNAILFVNK